MRADHVIVVTKDEDWTEDKPSWKVAVEPVGHESCGWRECPGDHDGFDFEDEDSPAFEQEEFEIHGVWHEWHYVYGWTVDSDCCAVADLVYNGWSDSAYDIARERGEGRYLVEDEWDDDILYLTVIDKEN